MTATRLRIARVELRDVGGELKAALGNARGAWRERRGLLLRIFDGDGVAGVGEATPLPGHSPDTLRSCAHALRRLAGREVTLDAAAPLGPQLLAAALPTAPAARFAAETALLDLLGRRLGAPLWRLLRGAGDPSPVPLSALLPDGDEAIDAARRAAALGMGAMKLKIGRQGRWRDELGLIEALRAAAALPLRLDANGAFSPEDAPARLAALRELAPELVEEPCAAAWPGVAGPPSPVPLAADESLLREDASDWLAGLLQRGLCQAVVLKPALLGGFGRCLQLAAQASAAGAAVIVTHLFDGPVALGAAAQLALALPRVLACGLAPHGALAAFPPCPLPAHGPAALHATEQPGLGVELDAGAARDLGEAQGGSS